MSSVDIRDVRKSFGNFEVLHGVSIPVEDGGFAVPVGPSGCGKSTLLRMLAGPFRERHQFSPSDKVRLKPDPSFVHLFDETTGKRMNA